MTERQPFAVDEPLLSRVTIYLVEDDEAVSDALSAILESHGADVEAFPSIGAASAVSFEKRPACLLLDLQLSDGWGIDLLRNLRDRGLEMPVIAMTGRTEPWLAAAAEEARVVKFLEKPVDGDEVAEMIYQAIRLSWRTFSDQ